MGNGYANGSYGGRVLGALRGGGHCAVGGRRARRERGAGRGRGDRDAGPEADAGAQNPTLRHVWHPIFDPPRRWAGKAAPTEEFPVDAAGLAMDLISASATPRHTITSTNQIALLTAQTVRAVAVARPCFEELGFKRVRVLPELWDPPPTDRMFCQGCQRGYEGMNTKSFLQTISDTAKIITPIDSAIRFPEVVDVLIDKYGDAIETFCQLIMDSSSSADVLRKIRSPSRAPTERMALLKMYRRSVSPVLDTETTKKIRKINSEMLIETYGHTFKPINKLHREFSSLPREYKYALAALVGEYDTRGQLGYELTNLFFDWFENRFAGQYTIEGPRGAGQDIELSDLFPAFQGSYPCDFAIRRRLDNEILAVGFARYDSTRGGAQSDDRTGGNANKVDKAVASEKVLSKRLKIIFLSDGPGLMHRDTWEEACRLDGQWGGRVRVTTLKLAEHRISPEWLEA